VKFRGLTPHAREPISVSVCYRTLDEDIGHWVVVIETFDIRTSAVLLDVDGTLLDLADTPHSVAVPQRLKHALQALALQSGGATSFVSGRSMADLDRLFEPLRLAAVAGHGAELRVPGKVAPRHYEAGIPADVRRRLMEFGASHEGIIVEDKGYSLALHYRLAPDKGEVVRTAAAKICSSVKDVSIELLPGKLVLEVKQTGFTKATAVRELMSCPPFAQRRPIFIGDDVTDFGVFEILPDFDGIGIIVGRRDVPGANAYFERPADVRRWLEQISRDDAFATP
jgi:trehalose 6-phosphate phosphatase